MHLLVRRGGSVKPPCKTLPGLAQLFVSKTCSSRRALCTEFLCPSTRWDICRSVCSSCEVRTAAACAALGFPSCPGQWLIPAHSVARSALCAPAAHPGGGEGSPRPWEATVPSRAPLLRPHRALFPAGAPQHTVMFPAWDPAAFGPSSGACDAQAYYKLRNLFSSPSSPFF